MSLVIRRYMLLGVLYCSMSMSSSHISRVRVGVDYASRHVIRRLPAGNG